MGRTDKTRLDDLGYRDLSGVFVDYFDYKDFHSEWVTHQKIGPKLAERISCLAAKSRQGGGGKVIVVAHSMGGLAARYALAQPDVSGMVGLVITMGTPHLGSGYGKFCQYTLSLPGDCSGSAPTALGTGSRELAELPHFPESMSVRAIAGSVFIRADFFFTHIDHDMGGDLVVGVDSATAEYTSTGRGDGKFVFKCWGDNAYPGKSHAPCEHNAMVNAGYIQEAVADGIKEYLAATKVTLHKVYGMSIPMQRNWVVTHQDESVTVIRDTASCDTELDESMEPYRAQIEKDKLWCAGMAITNLASPPDVTDGVACESTSPAQGSNIGGMSASYTVGHSCSNGIVAGASSLRTWNVKSKKIMIDVYDLPGRPFSGVTDALSAVRWG